MKFKFQAVHSAHAHIECTDACMSIYEDLYTTHVEDMQDIIETHCKSQEDCTKFSSDDLRNLSRNNWLIMNDKVNNNPLTL